MWVRRNATNWSVVKEEINSAYEKINLFQIKTEKNSAQEWNEGERKGSNAYELTTD